MDRREFVRAAAGGIGAWALGDARPRFEAPSFHDEVDAPAFATTVEVIGDGKWVWTKPPADKKGVLEPRKFSYWTRIAIQGLSKSGSITAGTSAPVEMPEQQIDDVAIETQGCTARLQRVGAHAGQMLVSAPPLAKGQMAFAIARYRLTLAKQFFGYGKEQFPEKQEPPQGIRKQNLFHSLGIQTRAKEVRALAEELADQLTHPWDKAHAFKKWVWKNIHSEKAMKYTGVVSAIRSGKGDCEERASVFAALCRHCGIPTRTVWVPNHVWAEFYLDDHQGEGHWIPAHTSGYTWFGLTGAHELILQKGDGVQLPGQRKRMRFLHDWAKFNGPRAAVQYTSEMKPLPEQPQSDPGPGGRIKPVSGPWTVGRHELDKYLLNGEQTKQSPFRKLKKEVEPWE